MSRAGPNPDVLIRVIGVALVLAGAALLGIVTTVSAVGNCNIHGEPNPCFFTPPQDTGTPLGSLKTVSKAQDPQLASGGPFIADQQSLVELGKSFFWDQQAGSDGQACGSCHFSAGADPRTRNAISPGLKATPVDHTFSLGGFQAPNSTVSAGELPSHKLSDISNRDSSVVSDSNDIVGSSGVFNRNFSAVGQKATGGANQNRVPSVPDLCTSVADPDGFTVQGVNVRKVEPRNTPTMINALFNNRNFWDGRAQDIFNGGSPFGARDPAAYVYRNGSPTTVRITFASLASQADGPPTSNFEMSCNGRTFPDIGHKLLNVQPLGLQQVSTSDSVLGGLAKSGGGLRVQYSDLIHAAFNSQLWSSNQPVTINGKSYSETEANFGLFWGLSVKAYMETLVANNSPVDQFFDGNQSALGDSARRGLNIFQSFNGVAPDPTNSNNTIQVTLSTGAPADARCITCHGGPETTNANIDNVQGQRLERMNLRNATCAIYDQGFLTTGVRPLNDDPAVAGLDPFNNSFAETFLAQQGTLTRLVPGVAQDTPPYGLNVTANPKVTGPPLGATTNCENQNIQSAFKAPQLRNVELTGPYFHNGGQLTLMQVVDFYNRGGDFDNAQVDENMHSLGMGEQDKIDVVNFLLALTDERVAHEQAPFDHPSLCAANGQVGDSNAVQSGSTLPGDGSAAVAADQVLCVQAVGAGGGARLNRYLGADPLQH
ncbi:MAG: cytochrome C peroxidase [Chloroflexi bacterium]|nr:cytochrome C peroxidase [Chloroflexota bacterium]